MDSKDIVVVDEQALNKIKNVLIKTGETLAVAESVTAGILQTAFASALDASKFFQGGITVYNLGQKTKHLNINPIHAESCNCVSDRVAREMALNISKLFLSDWGIGITGYAALDPVMQRPKPFAYFAIARKNEIRTSGFVEHEVSDPIIIQYDFANQIIKTLDLLLMH